jgi:hypothetical protein
MSQEFGWIAPEERDYSIAKSHDEILSFSRLFGSAAWNLVGSGEKKVVLLHEALSKVCNGTFPINTQTIGDCVSHGYAKGIEVLMAVEILLRKEPEKWPGVLTSTEWIYGTSRVIQGQGRLRNMDGSLGSWAQKAVKENGTLLRQKYDKYDLSSYSGKVAKDWGFQGLPYELEPIADEHPIQTTALVTSYEEARDAIANGYPVVVCSNQGFASKRDSEGFARAQGRWAHCMLFASVDDEYKRPGLLCVNSWGEHWIDGPKRHNQPEGSFWVDADDADRMLKQQDSYTLSNFKGYPAQEINNNLW